MTPNTPARANLIGSLWMVAAMALFAIEDALIKAAAATLPVAQVLMLFGGGGALVFAALARRKQDPLWHPDVASRPMRIRVLFEISGRLFYVLALALAPLSLATTILQATPIVVVAGAALFFKEQVGWRRWLAIFVGLAGVVIVLRPGADSFSATALLAVLGMLGFAGRDLASRAAPRSLSTEHLGLYGFLSIIVAGGLFTLWEQKDFVLLDLNSGLYMAGAVLFGVAAYGCLMRAMRTGDVASVTPFRYTRLLFGVGLGLLLFGETLDTPTLLGCLLIVASGLFIMWRGQKSH